MTKVKMKRVSNKLEQVKVQGKVEENEHELHSGGISMRMQGIR
jgi:hypothetical protein